MTLHIDPGADFLSVIVEKFSLGEIPDDLFIKMLECHERKFDQKHMEFLKALPELRSRFVKRIEELIEEGYLPIAKEDVKRRLKETEAMFVDIVRTSIQEVDGGYSPDRFRVSIGSHVESENWFHIYSHELIHALSGRTILLKTIKLGGKNHEVPIHQRLGLAFGSLTRDKGRFNWLNEAITESIAVRVTGKDNGKYYVYERKALEEMLKTGLSRDTLYKAYFENYDPDNMDKVPEWKNLAAHLKKIYESGMKVLFRFEKYFEKY